MSDKTPGSVIEKLMTASLEHDLVAAVSLYEEEATLVVYPGGLGKGKSSIVSYFRGFYGQKVNVEYEDKNLVEAGELALFTAKWTVLNPPQHMRTPTTNYQAMILRKQPDGTWLIAVDNPWGPAPAYVFRQ